jgi:hypothetical protein
LRTLRELASAPARRRRRPDVRGNPRSGREGGSNAGSKATRTWKLTLYDAKTGLVVKTPADGAIAKLYLRGISPSGKVLYDVLDNYRLVDLHVRFPAQPVARPAVQGFPPPAVFFADR